MVERIDRQSIAMEAKQQDRDEPMPPRDPWQHRSVHMKCRSCMAYAPKTDFVGRCRAKPPTMRGYPVVYPDSDWCLSHKLDEAWVERNTWREPAIGATPRPVK